MKNKLYNALPAPCTWVFVWLTVASFFIDNNLALGAFVGASIMFIVVAIIAIENKDT